MKFFSVALIFFLWELSAKPQSADSVSKMINQKDTYSFIIEDSPARLFTMRQFNEDYLSGYQLYSKMMNRNFSPFLNYLIQTSAFIFAFGPLTHEEGHRSILISKNVGSISQPFFLSKRGGYIDGVTDQTLVNLRNSDFPDYLRLYIAGLESDYMLTHREETLLAYGKESFNILAVEYLLRKFFIMEYYFMGFVRYDIDGNEEKNELKRDIVGNDVYGAVRHLFRPAMAFQRYTRYNDLTGEEKKFVHQMGYRSLLNLLNINLIGIPYFKFSPDLQMNIGFGHTMCPFGDFSDANIWLRYRERLKLNLYIRNFQNREHSFLAGGISMEDLIFLKRFSSNLSFHFWNQPETLSFNDHSGKMGGAVDIVGKYFIFTNQRTQLKALSIDLGIIAKTQGFLPEEIIMRQHLGIRLGTTFAFGK